MAWAANATISRRVVSSGAKSFPQDGGCWRLAVVRLSAKNLRSAVGFQNEMNLLLASLRRVEIRIEPESITDFLKWKNRMAEYNRGILPKGLTAEQDELNVFLVGNAGD